MNHALFHISFYRFVAIAEPEVFAVRLRQLASALKGVVLVAKEGINGALAGTAPELDQFEQAMMSDAGFAGAFAGMRFQRTGCARAPFGRLKVHVRAEVVQIGVKDVNALDFQGRNVPPEAWDDLIARPDVVLLDNRNHFEFALGRIRGALDPDVDLFSDFAHYMDRHLPTWQAQGKQIAMYCTGGIRCEKSSAWLAQQGVQSYQLEGGILNYLRHKNETGQASNWEGHCFVFDNRMALDSTLENVELTPEQVYQDESDAWRLARAKRLAESDPE